MYRLSSVHKFEVLGGDDDDNDDVQERMKGLSCDVTILGRVFG